MSNKQNVKIALIDILFFLLILSTGGLLHQIYGNILSPLFYFVLLIFFAVSDKKYQKSLIKQTIIIQTFVIIALFCNYYFAPFYNEPVFYINTYLRLLSTHIFLFFLLNYNYNVLDQLFRVLKFVALLSLINFLFSPIFSELSFLVSTDRIFIRTLGFIFNYASSFNVLGIDIYRNQGIFWEPGILQIYLNVLFFITTFVRNSSFYRWLSVFLIISTFSTTGLLLLVIQILVYYQKKIFQLNLGLKIFILVFSLPSLIYFLYQNLLDKISGDSVISFDLRLFDLLTAFTYITHFPLSGIGLDVKNYTDQQSKIAITNMPDFTFDVSSTVGLRGNTNSLLMLVVSLGVPIALFCIYRLYKQRIINNKKKLFFLIVVISCMSEPLILGNFFMLLFLSSSYKFEYYHVGTDNNRLLVD
ncbi:hypothetical protein [Flavobacterium chungangensis]|uniref:Polysaccharide polymerase n=1 Tax=Flavobacterium chungangensis TaxID=2708132 RepID=A0ABV8ZGL4_9FLAO